MEIKSSFLGQLVIFLIFLTRSLDACDIVGASACPHRPDNDLKEENFPIYCEQFKKNLECVAKKYKGCDRMETYTLAMKSMVQVLKRKAKEIEELCKITIDLQETKPTKKTTTTTKTTKKKTTKKKPRNSKNKTTQTTTTTTITTTTTTTTTQNPQCKINTIPSSCHSILNNVQFNAAWTGAIKQKWCNSATSYYNCIKLRLQSCYGVQYMESMSYYEKIQNYVLAQSNKNCPGGIDVIFFKFWNFKIFFLFSNLFN